MEGEGEAGEVEAEEDEQKGGFCTPQFIGNLRLKREESE